MTRRVGPPQSPLVRHPFARQARRAGRARSPLHRLEPRPPPASECLPRLGVPGARRHSDPRRDLARGPSSVRRRRRGSLAANAALHWRAPCGDRKSCGKRLQRAHVLPCGRTNWRTTPPERRPPLSRAPPQGLRAKQQPPGKTTGKDARMVWMLPGPAGRRASSLTGRKWRQQYRSSSSCGSKALACARCATKTTSCVKSCALILRTGLPLGLTLFDVR